MSNYNSMVYNFSPGPSMLPKEVLLKIYNNADNWYNSGVSVVELNHRSKIAQDFIYHLQDKLRNLLDIPDNYKILFLQGGARGQFDAVPMNLLRRYESADYIITGLWSSTAASYAKKYIQVDNMLSNNITNKYCYYCSNETVDGIYFTNIEQLANYDVLVADITSSVGTYHCDISKHGIVFASAQKNLGISGICLVIVREDLLDYAISYTPAIWNYKDLDELNSCVNSLPLLPLYVMDIMVDWIKNTGGVDYFYQFSLEKSKILYNYIDNSTFYYNNVAQDSRSIVNVPFFIQDKSLIPKFLDQADKVGLKALNGHRTVGGLRATMYNSMPMEGVVKLLDFMQMFAKYNT